MKVISIINLKGGVGKTASTINIAYSLAMRHDYRVLVIDNDKQGNTSKFFGCHDYDKPSIADLLTRRSYDIHGIIQPTAYRKLDLIPANMLLLKADKEVLLDCTRPQQTRLRKALQLIAGEYDFCLIDNAPDLSMSVINGLVAADDVMIPIKIDRFAFDGVDLILNQIEDIREFNPNIHVAGGFVTMYQRCNVNAQGQAYLAEHDGLPMFEACIRKTVAMDETTFAGIPIAAYSPSSTAAQDYAALTDEYLKMCPIRTPA